MAFDLTVTMVTEVSFLVYLFYEHESKIIFWQGCWVVLYLAPIRSFSTLSSGVIFACA